MTSIIVRNTIVGGSLRGGSCDWYVTSDGGNLDTGGTQSTLSSGGAMLPPETACFLSVSAQTSDPVGDARRQIKGGGLRINDSTVTDEKMLLTPDLLTPEGVIKLSLGRKRHVLLKPV